MKIIKSLKNLSDLLMECNEPNWANSIVVLTNSFEITSREEQKQLAREGLNFFGGMGSLNDIVLHKNGIPLLEENDKLDTLRNEIYSELVEISRS
jgi:hypothetical protein